MHVGLFELTHSGLISGQNVASAKRLASDFADTAPSSNRLTLGVTPCPDFACSALQPCLP
ncbi:hypothetical protein EMIT0P74_80003 [Pseudomonas sp. IT-P74]